MMQTLATLASAIGISEKVLKTPDMPICDIAYNSKKAGNGVLFVCLVGAVTDGHSYAEDAYARGTRVFVAKRPLLLPSDAEVLLVSDTRRALALLSAAFFEHPEQKLTIIGITGTKGKSTVAELVRHILSRNGIRAASVGTVGIRMENDYIPTANTTPESYELFRIFAELVKRDITHAVIEVSSQGIKLHRILGIPFHTAVMTNLSEDHIGASEHPDFQDYKACKKMLFSACQHAVMNLDDPYFEEFHDAAPSPVTTYSVKENADICAKGIMPLLTDTGYATSFMLRKKDAETPVMLPFPGEFSVSNALAAVATAMLLGIPAEKAAPALANASVKGRFEIVPTPIRGATFVIDYAHNGESLSAALKALRAYQPNRLICLFGSVGGRTELRRSELGAAASRYADFSILTDDNPDRERSEDIIHDIEMHMGDALRIAIPDRGDAIEYAVSMAGEGDIILFAGKGHEEYQLINGKKMPFSERALILAAAEKVTVSG